MLDLNTITKKDFVNELILSDDLSDFYLPNEKVLLSLDFDFEEMKEKFENWLEIHSNNTEVWQA
jgi:hypothetical protein